MADDHFRAEAIAALTAEDFEPHVGRNIQVAGTFKLVLARVDRTRRAVPDATFRAPFSLLFSAPKKATIVPEGLYTFDFGEVIVHEMHIAPIHTPSPDRQDYEAVFN